MQTVNEIFQNELPRLKPEYEPRQGQLAMVNAVGRYLDTLNHTFVEAATGVGKSLAYLIPAANWALENKKRVVIATFTKALQNQLLEKDLPLVKRSLAGKGLLKAALAKGRSNYVCLRRLSLLLDARVRQDEIQQTLFESDSSKDEQLERIVEQVEKGIGERGFFNFSVAGVWPEVCCMQYNCLKYKCPWRKQCFFNLAREQLADSQLLIVNHALFFADLALREAGYGILPAYERVIFDEAHHLEDVAASSFAVNMDYAKIRNYSLMVVSPNTKFGQALKTHPTLYHEVSAVRKEVEEKAAEFFAYLNSFCVDNYAKTYSQKQLEADDLSEGLKRLNQLLKRQELPDILQLDDEARMELENLINSGQVLLNELEFLLASSSGNHVYWAEKHHVSDLPNLKASPIELGELLGDKLFSEVPGFFTSATLSISGSFDFIANRLGISSYQEGICCSPFRFEEQALLYIPQKGVSPKESSYNDYLVECCRDLLDCAGGKAFILFTSYFSLQYCSLKLGEWLEHKGFSPLIQSKGTSPYRLVEEFKTLDNPVLFGTSSFWEGVDVPGDQLSMVVITKLPFMVPTHPLENARITRLEQGGGNGFTQYSLPKAVVRFKQGFGRLIRTKHDKGVVAVLDTRVKSTWYGKHFLRSLPAVDCTDRLERVSSFLNN